MKKARKRKLILILIPLATFLLLVTGYVIYDPLKVLRQYDTYSIAEINLNRDYISTETLLNHHQEEGYNAFIFGSSRSMGYDPKTWKKYLRGEVKPYAYDAYNENLFGISRKLSLLDTMNIPIQHVLILVDPEAAFFITHNTPDALSRKHPALLSNTTGEWVAFQTSQFGAYLKLKFFIPYYLSKLGAKGQIASSYKAKRGVLISYPDNWMNSPQWEAQTEEDDYYYNAEFKRETTKETHLQPFIQDEQRYLLYEIRRILTKNQTNYTIIINPLYNRNILNERDIKTLREIFGEEHMHDFSGKNDFTSSEYNYFDRNHFKPHVGESIFAMIYASQISSK